MKWHRRTALLLPLMLLSTLPLGNALNSQGETSGLSHEISSLSNLLFSGGSTRMPIAFPCESNFCQFLTCFLNVS